MKLKTLIIAAAVLNAGIMGATIASAKGHEARASFTELDTNGDGEVTLAEMQALKAARFASADANGDGALSAEEMAAQMDERRANRIERMIERHDENGDGLLQEAELPQRGGEDRMTKRFERLDADNSGGLSEEEMAKAKDKRGNGQKRDGKRDDG